MRVLFRRNVPSTRQDSDFLVILVDNVETSPWSRYIYLYLLWLKKCRRIANEFRFGANLC